EGLPRRTAPPCRQIAEADTGAFDRGLEPLKTDAPADLPFEMMRHLHRSVDQATQPASSQRLQGKPELEATERPCAFERVVIKVEAIRLRLQILLQVAGFDPEAVAQGLPVLDEEPAKTE